MGSFSYTNRSAQAGGFALVFDKVVGYIHKIDMGKMKGEVVANNLGPSIRQKKMVTRSTFDPITFEIGMGMGIDVLEWMQASFALDHQRRDGAIVMFDSRYQVLRRMEFRQAHLIEIAPPKLSAKGKDSMKFTLKMQPEYIEYQSGGGNLAAEISEFQKLHANTNWEMDVGGLPCDNVSDVDLSKYTVKVAEDPRCKDLTGQYVPCAYEMGDITITFGAQDFEKWHEDAFNVLIRGNRSEQIEKRIGITILGPNAKDPIAQLEYENCGWKHLQYAEAMEANKEAAANAIACFYTEACKMKILKGV